MSVFRIGNRIVNYGGNLLYGTWTPPPPPKYVYLDDIHTLVPNDSTWYQINNGGIVYSQNHYNSHEGQDPSMYNVSSNVPEYDEYGWTYCEDEYVPKSCMIEWDAGKAYINGQEYDSTSSPYIGHFEDVDFYSNYSVSKIKIVGCESLRTCYGMFEKCLGLRDLDISEMDTSNVTSMGAMFYMCAATPDLSTLNTSKVENMAYMFSGSRFSKLDLRTFDTSNVTSMYSMFEGFLGSTAQGADIFNLTSFKTSKVTDMRAMFQGCTNVTYLNLSSFDTRNCSTELGYMFYGCTNLTTLDISRFTVRYSSTLETTFSGCKSLNVIYVDYCDAETLSNIGGVLGANRYTLTTYNRRKAFVRI